MLRPFTLFRVIPTYDAYLFRHRLYGLQSEAMNDVDERLHIFLSLFSSNVSQCVIRTGAGQAADERRGGVTAAVGTGYEQGGGRAGVLYVKLSRSRAAQISTQVI